jgi:hypothetical protein
MKKTFVLEEGKNNMEIRKVLLRSDGIKSVTIPKNSDFKKGDYVYIRRLTEVENG